MSAVLALDTSSAWCTVAVGSLAHPETAVEDTQKLGRLHNERLLGMIDGVCTDARVERRDISLITFACGPGSFTGVRIAAAVTQGIAFATGASVVPLRTSSCLAAAALASGVVRVDAPFMCGIRSRGDAYYLAAYRQATGSTLPEVLMADQLCTEAPAWDHLDRWLSAGCVGEMPPWLDDRAGMPVPVTPSARVMAAMAVEVHSRGASQPPEQALPLYVEGDSPWRPSQS